MLTGSELTSSSRERNPHSATASVLARSRPDRALGLEVTADARPGQPETTAALSSAGPATVSGPGAHARMHSSSDLRSVVLWNDWPHFRARVHGCSQATRARSSLCPPLCSDWSPNVSSAPQVPCPNRRSPPVAEQQCVMLRILSSFATTPASALRQEATPAQARVSDGTRG